MVCCLVVTMFFLLSDGDNGVVFSADNGLMLTGINGVVFSGNSGL